MGTVLTIHDETASGQTTKPFKLDCLEERITVRKVIRARIHQEVQDYNQKQSGCLPYSKATARCP